MKKLIIIVALFSANALDGNAEIHTLIAKENALRMRFNNMAASHNEVVTKEQSDELIKGHMESIIHLIQAKHVTIDKCESAGESLYKANKSWENDFIKMGTDKEIVDRYILAIADYSEAVCNAYLTRDEK